MCSKHLEVFISPASNADEYRIYKWQRFSQRVSAGKLHFADNFWEHISFTALIDALEVFCPIILATF